MSRVRGGVSTPPYTFRHSGPVLVCGNAWCLHEDLERVKSLYPEAPLIAVNGASREIPAFMLVSQHPENFVNARWVHHQRKFKTTFTVHATKSFSLVDYVWELNHRGGSAWLARKIAGSIGFDPVILCGCPMEVGNYASHKPGLLMSKKHVVEELAKQILKDEEWHKGCYSMSGWTRELLGSPC